ncbi:uncharacterized protein LOC111629957 [Centruroides sculpturatus]|uniref:uncharacterized protein LOC111629957 n=1 Tax=Centruroides sculpturatus TaxID=218467 RepID=UPI000C6E5CB1|nr:uncharacterized protein LOC111629957 [Centruroides sculpturatus]
MDEFENHIKSVDRWKVETFTLENCHFPALPEYIFEDIKVNRIEFSDVILPFLGPPLSKTSPFRGLEHSLEEFVMKNVSYLYNWNWSLLSDLHHLTKLTVTKSKVLRINKSFSSISNSLLKIEMTECKIKRIDDGSFKSFCNLKQLNLNKNQLTSLKRSYLPNPATELNLIDIR